MKHCLCRILFVVLVALAANSHADRVNAAVAANFTAAMKKLVPLFEAKTGHLVIPSFGATGQLYGQISHGAPFDVFLSADNSAPQKLIASGNAIESSYFVYARGRVALWSATPGYVDSAGAILKSNKFSKIAIANPKTAPYGQAAIDTLTSLKLLGQLQPLFVQGESLAQTLQFVASGNVPLGFIALGQVMALPPSERGSYWLVPASLHQPIDQAAVVLTAAKSPSASQAFMEFLQSPEALQVIRSLGYEAPGGQ